MKDIKVYVQAPGSIRYSYSDIQTIDDPWMRKRSPEVIVLHTTPAPTRAALHSASALAAESGAELVLLAVREIPFPLPLDRPHFQPALCLRQLVAITEGLSCPIRIELLLTRSRRDAMRRVGRDSRVVIATKKHWWRTEEERLARHLTRAGINVSLLTLDTDKGDLVDQHLSHPALTISTGVTTEQVHHA